MPLEHPLAIWVLYDGKVNLKSLTESQCLPVILADSVDANFTVVRIDRQQTGIEQAVYVNRQREAIPTLDAMAVISARRPWLYVRILHYE